jgi:hypothetical protein
LHLGHVVLDQVVTVERDKNDSVPLNAIMSTSWSAGCKMAQLPSGLRGAIPWPLTVLVKLPVAAVNCPVPPVTAPVCCSVSLNRQLRGFRENEVMDTVALTRCMVPQRRPDRPG